MAARPRPPCWSAWNESRRCHLALRQMPDGMLSAAAPVLALSRRYVRTGSGLSGRGGGDFDHPAYARADRLAAATHRQRAYLRRPAHHGRAHRRVRTRHRDRVVRGKRGAVRRYQEMIRRTCRDSRRFISLLQRYPAFFHAASASKTRRAAFAIAASIMRPSTVVEALPCASAWSNASNTRA